MSLKEPSKVLDIGQKSNSIINMLVFIIFSALLIFISVGYLSLGYPQLIFIGFITILLIFRNYNHRKIIEFIKLQQQRTNHDILIILDDTLSALDFTLKAIPKDETNKDNIQNATRQIQIAKELCNRSRTFLNNFDTLKIK